jgi:hypothetical protein
MVRSARLAATLGFVGLLFVVFAVNGALEGRWRDAVEGGVPALLLLAGAAVVTKRAFAKR